MSLGREACRGVWVPLVTPFAAGEGVDVGALERLVGWLVGAGVHGLVALGTTGEAPHLDDDEAETVVRAAVRAAAGRVPVLAGSGRASTRSAIAAGLRWAAAGADGLLVLAPHAYRSRMDAAALRRHYLTLAEAAPVPVFVYHMPEMTGLDLDADLLADLMAHANIWGFKDSSTEAGPLAAVLRRARTCGFVGSGARFLDGLRAGACGGILAAAQLVPEVYLRLYAAWQAADAAAAEQAQAAARQVVQALRGWNVPGIKFGLELRGMPAGAPRSPLPQAPPAVRARIAAALRSVLGAGGAPNAVA